MSVARPVLLVEDDPALRRLLASALTRDGYDVVAVADGRSCIAWLQAARDEGRVPALVLTDLRMPGGGFEFVARICRGLPGVPVLLMTAFADSETHDRARVAGASQVFDKPLDVDLLRARVAELAAA